ncbi:hypothetical protein M0R45_005790 [Rubus argutus]|uniref:Diacylglycerol kinase accessory domain-containing protein n=1 Tax=Rubus argutus TaxID=59490 RepID=A0AAW1YNM0_RUBAR
MAVWLEVDGKDIDIPKDSEGLIVLNIGSYMGGVDLWQMILIMMMTLVFSQCMIKCLKLYAYVDRGTLANYRLDYHKLGD